MPEPTGRITFREATAQDAAFVAGVYNDSVVVETASWDTEPETVEHRAAWLADHARNGDVVLIALLDGEPVGWGSLGRFNTKKGYRHTREHTLYLARDAQGHGVGRALLTELIQRARAAGTHTLIGLVSSENEASLALHEKLGFVEVGRLRQVGAKFGRWLDLVHLQLMLDQHPVPGD